VHRPDPVLDRGEPLRERRRRRGGARGLDPFDRLRHGSPQLFKRIALRCGRLDGSFNPLDQRIGAGLRCNIAAKVGGGDGRRCRRGCIADLVGCRAITWTAPITDVRRRKRALHDGVVAVRPKAVVARRQEYVFDEIARSVGPKYRCRPLWRYWRRPLGR